MPMKWRWLIGDHIDPSLGLTREERREVRCRVHKLCGTAWRRYGDLVLLILIMFAPAWIVWPLTGIDERGQADVTFADSCAVTIFLVWMPLSPFIWVVANAIFAYRCRRPYVFKALQSLGYEVCGRCGYRLHGLDEAETRCPECGEPRSTCTCPHCGKALPFRTARGMRCPECGQGFDQPVPVPSLWLGRSTAYLTVDRRLRKALSRAERRGLRRRVLAGLRWWQRLLIATLWTLLFMPIGLVAYQAAYLLMGLQEDLLTINNWIIGIVITVWLGVLIAVRLGLGGIYSRPLRRLLRQGGYEVCMRCGCWLRDLTDDEQQCPVCGAPREPMEGGG